MPQTARPRRRPRLVEHSMLPAFLVIQPLLKHQPTIARKENVRLQARHSRSGPLSVASRTARVSPPLRWSSVPREMNQFLYLRERLVRPGAAGAAICGRFHVAARSLKGCKCASRTLMRRSGNRLPDRMVWRLTLTRHCITLRKSICGLIQSGGGTGPTMPQQPARDGCWC
jgi:hypothetical protein